MQRYNPSDIESKWQQKWEADGIYRACEDLSKPKKYILEYFPYPSGAAMHVGHVRNYTIGDATARFMRMQGNNVLHPMGWDAFGLPAENYAIKTGVSPRQAIDQNTARFKQQLTQMGFSYDWSREIDSTDPKYYKWTQWFFLMLFKRGLAYQQESLQWWCPVDKTVLANEQVENGKCWRCGNDVEKKALKQWFFKITDYADRLLDDLEDLDWSDAIKTMQRNWIGRSKGAEVTFAIDGSEESLSVFTTRPDTLFGVTFMVLAPEHALVKKLTTEENRAKVEAYLAETRKKSDIERQETNREKTGVFTGSYAVNPVNGEKIPIWVADYVLMGYGTGAIMAVPAHDERDYAFAKKFELPVKQVIAERFIHEANPHQPAAPLVPRDVVTVIVKHPTEDKCLIVKPNQGDYWSPLMGGIDTGETPEETAKRELKEETGYDDLASTVVADEVIASEFYAQHKAENRIAFCRTVTITLASLRQKPVAEEETEKQETKWVSSTEARNMCKGGGAQEIFDLSDGLTRAMVLEGYLINSDAYNGVPTPEAREKIVVDLEKKGAAKERVNYKMRDWLISRQRYWGAPIPIIHCPKDGVVPVPEDQLPVVLPEVKSFEPSGDGRSPLANVPEFVHTTCPKCGGKAERETDTMDGFACSSWYFLRFADPHNDEAPFDKDKAAFWLPVDDYIGGAEHAVMHLLYARFWTKVMYDEGLITFQEPFKALRNQGMILAPDGLKMSKSKGNTIEPGELIDQGYGADAIRIMELFIGPWNQSANWSVEGMGGAFRFLQRVWTLVQEQLAGDSTDISQQKELERAIAKVTKRVTEDLHTMSFNTAIAALMEAVNELYKLKTMMPLGSDAWRTALTTFVQLLAPFAPHISEELWQQLGQTDSVHLSQWPTWDDNLLVETSVTVAIQINGKVRGEVVVDAGASQEQVLAAAQAQPQVASYLADQEIKKLFYVPNKLLSVVL